MERGVAVVCAGVVNVDVQIIGSNTTMCIGEIYGVCRCAMMLSTKWSVSQTNYVAEVYKDVTD